MIYHAKYSKADNGEQSARERYIAIAKQVGWKGEGLEGDEDEEIDFDEPEPEKPEDGSTPPKKDAAAMWVRVSALKEEGTVVQYVWMVLRIDTLDQADGRDGSSPVHDAVVGNNLEETRRLLKANPQAVNTKDEFVH